MRRRSLAAVLAAAATLSLAPAWPAAADGLAFTPDLQVGQPSGVTVHDGVVQLAATAPTTPLDPPAALPARPRIGLLTLPPRTLDTPIRAVDPRVSAEQPPGTSTVDYLWTGRALLRQVAIDRPLIEVRSAPRADAAVVGWAANRAGVGVECSAPGWLRIGPGQFLLGTAVPSAAATPPCP